MKSFRLLLLTSFFPLLSFSQDSTKIVRRDSGAVVVTLPKEGRKSSLLFLGEHVQLGNRSMQSFGLGVHIPVGKHMGLNYRFGLGRTSDRKFYMRTTLGGATGGWLLGNVGDGIGSGFVEALGVILMLVPEGVSFDMDVGKTIKFRHYVNPLCADFIGNSNPADEEFLVTGSIGSSMRFPIAKRWYAMPHAGVKFNYKSSDIGFEAGATIGLNLKD